MNFLLEYCSRGSLSQLLRCATRDVPEEAVWFIISQIAKVLSVNLMALSRRLHILHVMRTAVGTETYT